MIYLSEYPPRGRGLHGARALVLCCLVCITDSVHAQSNQSVEQSAEARQPHKQSFEAVWIGVIARDAPLQDLRVVLSEWLGSAGLSVQLQRERRLDRAAMLRPGARGQLRLWMRVSNRNARLYFADPAATRYLVRDVPLSTDLDELGRERLAQVIHSAVLALREGELGLNRQQVEAELERELPQAEPAPKPSPTKLTGDTGPPWQLRGILGGYYGLTIKGNEGVAQGPGVTFGLGVDRSGFRVSPVAHLQWQFPHRGRSERLQIESRAAALSGGVLVGHLPSDGFSFSGELLGGVDIVSYEPRSLSADIEVRDGERELRSFLALQFWVGYALSDFQLSWGARLALPLQDTHYDLVVEDERQVELTGASIQPSVQLGLFYR